MSDDAARDACVLELAGLSKNELDKRLAKYGVKPLPRGQAVSFLASVHLLFLKKKSNFRRNSSAKKSRKACPKRNVVDIENPDGATGQAEPSTSSEIVSSGIQKEEKNSKKIPKKTKKFFDFSKEKSVESNNGKDLEKDASNESVVFIPDNFSATTPSDVGRSEKSASKMKKKLKKKSAKKDFKEKKISSRKDYKVKLLDSSSEEGEDSAESEMDLAAADLVQTKKPKPKKLVTFEEVKEVMTKYIRDRPTLYDQILQYETIYLKPFVKQLKEDGIDLKIDLLMDFFDSQTICFSQHNAEKPRQWGGKKRETGSRSPKKKD